MKTPMLKPQLTTQFYLPLRKLKRNVLEFTARGTYVHISWPVRDGKKPWPKNKQTNKQTTSQTKKPRKDISWPGKAWLSEDAGVARGEAAAAALPSGNLPGRTCESAPPRQQTRRARFRRSDSACSAPPLRPTGPDGIYPGPTRSRVWGKDICWRDRVKLIQTLHYIVSYLHAREVIDIYEEFWIPFTWLWKFTEGKNLFF